MPSSPAIKRFKGLNNVSDPLTVGASWLVQANNVDVGDDGKLRMRTGYTLTMAAVPSGAYATIDEQRMYIVDAGSLKAMADAATAVTLSTGLTTAPVAWTEINSQVFFTNGTDSGVIMPDNEVRQWGWDVPAAPTLAAVTGTLAPGLYRACVTTTLPDGRETGPSEVVELVLGDGQALQVSGIAGNLYISPADSTVFQLADDSGAAAIVWNSSPDDLGTDLRTFGMDPLPEGCEVIAAWGGHLVAARYFPEHGQSAIFKSQPLGFHLFDLEAGLIMVPGRVLMLAPHADGLVIGTDDAVLVYTADDRLTELAPYGVVAGQHWSEDDDGTVLFWTQRGVCRALPFTNLTQQNASVAPGVRAAGAVVRMGGQRRFIVSIQQGGSAFNAH